MIIDHLNANISAKKCEVNKFLIFKYLIWNGKRAPAYIITARSMYTYTIYQQLLISRSCAVRCRQNKSIVVSQTYVRSLATTVYYFVFHYTQYFRYVLFSARFELTVAVSTAYYFTERKQKKQKKQHFFQAPQCDSDSISIQLTNNVSVFQSRMVAVGRKMNAIHQ